jgi:hypothetical protein
MRLIFQSDEKRAGRGLSRRSSGPLIFWAFLLFGIALLLMAIAVNRLPH